AVDLDQQDGAGVGRIARVVVRLHRPDGDAVHHLERGGDDAATDHSGDSLACGLDRGEGGEQRRHAGWRAEQADLDLGDRAKGPLGADEYAAQVEADAIRYIPADPMNASVREHDLHAQNVVGGDAVIEAVG